MEFSEETRIINLELFDPAFYVVPSQEDGAKRRFMMLFAHRESSRRGGSADLFKVSNVFGETFALKRLRIADGSASGLLASEGGSDSAAESGRTAGAGASGKVLRNSSSTSSRSQTPDYVTRGHVAAFYEEYRVHLAVSSLRGFPRVYGFGFAGGKPVIVMEWVEGATLREAVRRRGAVCDVEVVADLGLAVLELLERAGELDETFVHRDISPRNIMLREDAKPAAEQLESGDFDVCLVDFGSAALLDVAAADPTFTMQANAWRLGTPAYAPPEMLNIDAAVAGGVRQSPVIDVYALCSVLYELYTGRKPFDVTALASPVAEGGSGERSPYMLKMSQLPDPIEPREPDGGALASAVMTGLSPDQGDRPSLDQLRAAFENWKEIPSARVIGELDGAKPSSAGLWQPGYARAVVTRRRFVAAGIVAAGAVVSACILGGAFARGRGGERQVDLARYGRAAAPYAGEPLFKALDGNRAGWMFCAADGRIACKPASSREPGNVCEGTAALFDDASGLYGYIVPDEAASWLVLPAFADARGFAEGLAAVQDAQSKLWGYVDAQGAWTVPARFSRALDFGGGIAPVAFDDAGDASDDAAGGGCWGAIDARGNVVIEPSFSALGRFSDEGFAVAEEAPGSWGVVDSAGAWSSSARFGLLRRFSAGMAAAYDDASGLWGYVDAHGDWAIAPAFSDARPFSAGPDALAAVQDALTRLWYFIGADGSAHAGMKPRFWKLGDLRDGLAPAQASPEDSAVVFDEADPDNRVQNAGMRYGYVDANGQWQMRRLTTLVDTAIGAPGI